MPIMPVSFRARSQKWYRNRSVIYSIVVILILVSIGVSYFTLQALHQTVAIPPSAQAKTHVILIDQPKHRFHSDHWYHVGEYYISQQQSLHQQYHLQGNNAASSVVLIGTRDPKFMKKMTKMVLFFIAASFGGHYDSVEIVAYDQIDGLFEEYRGTLQSCLSSALYRLRTTFNSFHRRAVIRFDVNQPLEHRFEFITTASTYWSRFGTNRHRISVGDKNKDKQHSTAVTVGPGYSLVTNNSIPHPTTAYSSPAVLKSKTFSSLSSGSAIGSMGRLPVDSGKWFRSDEEALRMRLTIAWMCRPLKHTTNATQTRASPQPYRTETRASPRRYRLVIYERNNDRHIQDLDRVVALLTKGTTRVRDGQGDAPWDIEVLRHSDDMDPCSLHHSLRDADLFLTTHGFQALALLFLKPGAVLVEIFPYKYFKPSYLKLSATYGIHHRWRQNTQPTSFNRLALHLVSQQTCMNIRRCRSHARGDSVVMTSDDITYVLNVTRDIEEGRLGAHNAPSLG